MKAATRSEALALRPYQEAARQAIHAGFRDFDRQLAVMPTGCHAPGHPILMADGTSLAVEHVEVGHLVMGPDGRPRRVLRLHSGTDHMVRIMPAEGAPFVVNARHVLSVAEPSSGSALPGSLSITVAAWLAMPREFRRRHRLWRVRLEHGQVKGVTFTSFRAEPAGTGPYHGFTLDGDHLYLDGSFTVHHNSGKTVLFSALAADYQPGRTLILAHREELIDQAVKKLHAATGLWGQVEMADQKASPHAPVVVASIQTLARVPRLTRWPKDHFRLVVCDESHHSVSASWQGVLNHFHDHAKVLGVTASPDRGDKRNLGEYFQNIAYEVSLLDLVRDGFLCPIRIKTVPLGIDLRGVRTTAGDYNVDDLGHALDPWLDRIADVLAEHRHRKTIVFLPLVALSKSFAERCRQRGMAAAHVDGMSPDRADILDRFRRDELRLLTNAMLLSEGYDEPSIDCVVNLRPTKVRSLFCQILGRGTRIHPGKDHLLVLDFLFQAGEHKLIRPAHLIARDEVHAQALIEALGEEGDLEEAEQRAEADRTRKLVDRLRNNRHRRSTEVDALELAVALHENALADFVPEVPWHEDPPTAKQIQILKRFGIDPDTVTCKGHASLLLDRLFMRRQLHLATPKQVRLLRRMGVPNAETIGFEQAHELLAARFTATSA